MASTICGGIRGEGTSIGNFKRIGDTKVKVGIISVIMFGLRNNSWKSLVFNMIKSITVKAIVSVVMFIGFFIPSSMPY